MPALSRTYRLTWADIEAMPYGELEAYLNDLGIGDH
jgi:hypothetical protein